MSSQRAHFKKQKGNRSTSKFVNGKSRKESQDNKFGTAKRFNGSFQRNGGSHLPSKSPFKKISITTSQEAVSEGFNTEKKQFNSDVHFKKPQKQKGNGSISKFVTGESRKQSHAINQDNKSGEASKAKRFNGRKRKRSKDGSFKRNGGSGLPNESPFKKICVATSQEAVSEGYQAEKKRFKSDVVKTEEKTLKAVTSPASSNSDVTNPPLVTASFVKKKCLPSKPEDVSQNWKAYLQARTERRKQTRTPFLKKAQPTEEQPEVWFDDVDEILLDKPENTTSTLNSKGLVRPNSFAGLTKVLAMDCEMVGVGLNGRDSIVARVSIVNQFGQCVYDKYVAPTEKVTDYRTAVSGIRAQDIAEGVPFKTVQKEVSDMLEGRILVGHAVHHDLKVLFLDHPRNYTRDSSEYKPFRKVTGGGKPSLKRLSEKLLQVRVQEGEHNSVQDAQAAMRLYTLHKKEWESSLKFKRKKPSKQKKMKTG